MVDICVDALHIGDSQFLHPDQRHVGDQVQHLPQIVPLPRVAIANGQQRKRRGRRGRIRHHRRRSDRLLDVKVGIIERRGQRDRAGSRRIDAGIPKPVEHPVTHDTSVELVLRPAALHRLVIHAVLGPLQEMQLRRHGNVVAESGQRSLDLVTRQRAAEAKRVGLVERRGTTLLDLHGWHIGRT